MTTTTTTSLVVDGYRVAGVRFEAWRRASGEEEGAYSMATGEIQVVRGDGYVREHRIWRGLGRRCRVVGVDEDSSTKLAQYVEQELMKRQKAAIVASRKGAVVACLAPARPPTLLFRNEEEESSRGCRVELLVENGTVKLATLDIARFELDASKIVIRNYGAGAAKSVKRLDAAAFAYSESIASFADANAERQFHAFVGDLQRKDKIAVGDGVWLTGSSHGQLDVWASRDELVVVVVSEKRDDDQIAASFYNSLERSKETEGKTRIYHLRRFNNWVKSELLGEATEEACGGRPAAVLDLACGKGGDLGKFRRVREYVGVDIAQTSLNDLAERLVTSRPRAFQRVPVKLLAASLGSRSLSSEPPFPLWTGTSDGGTWGTGHLDPWHQFDVASMQFALHYMFETEARATSFFSDLASLVRVGGRFVATTVDAVALSKLVIERATPAEPPPSLGGGAARWWRVDIDDETGEEARGLGPVGVSDSTRRVLTVWVEDATRSRLISGDGWWGLRYWFQLYDGHHQRAVDSPEWLAPPPLLRKLASDHGFSLERSLNFASFLRHKKQHTTAFQSTITRLRVPDRHGTLSPAEWDVARLYVTLSFRRQPTETQIAASYAKVKKAWGPRWTTIEHSKRLDLVHACAEGRDHDWRPPS
ncbi:hypothetical protein CTAYLR_000952 [Chrysophaeum taylorii]|uniref:mRNA (guanine-N(7))-methyltransferase n=1 Tax=Chrysophaeum taylorii TaxID=2483200 RepID=A0AAD7XLG0_9STRA|nr:hypothetical protein CTAYLR_000952 [Chrysophaeum taylorii]